MIATERIKVDDQIKVPFKACVKHKLHGLQQVSVNDVDSCSWKMCLAKEFDVLLALLFACVS